MMYHITGLSNGLQLQRRYNNDSSLTFYVLLVGLCIADSQFAARTPELVGTVDE